MPVDGLLFGRGGVVRLRPVRKLEHLCEVGVRVSLHVEEVSAVTYVHRLVGEPDRLRVVPAAREDLGANLSQHHPRPPVADVKAPGAIDPAGGFVEAVQLVERFGEDRGGAGEILAVSPSSSCRRQPSAANSAAAAGSPARSSIEADSKATRLASNSPPPRSACSARASAMIRRASSNRPTRPRDQPRYARKN